MITIPLSVQSLCKVEIESNIIIVKESPSAYVYTINKMDLNSTNPKWNVVWLNQTIPASITQYQTESEALAAIATASSKNLPYYLKHKIENGIVTESYVEFVVTEEMASANPGMVAGTYALRGEKTGNPDTYELLVNDSYISPYYESNKETIKIAFGYATNPSRCSESGTGFYSNFNCSVSGLYVDAYANGDTSVVSHSGSNCGVGSYDNSHCYW